MLIHGVQVEVNRTSVSEWPNIGQVVLPLSECRLNCSHRGMCMLWTGRAAREGPAEPALRLLLWVSEPRYRTGRRLPGGLRLDARTALSIVHATSCFCHVALTPL